MTAKVFTGPGEYVYPSYLDPSGSGTLVAVPGRTYDFSGDPPGPAWWWADPAPPPPAPAPAVAKAPAAPATPATPAPAAAATTGQEG